MPELQQDPNLTDLDAAMSRLRAGRASRQSAQAAETPPPAPYLAAATAEDPRGERLRTLESQAAAAPGARLGQPGFETGPTAQERLLRLRNLVDAPPLQSTPAYASWGDEPTPGRGAELAGSAGMGGAYGVLRAGSNLAQLASLSQPHLRGTIFPSPGEIESRTQQVRGDIFEPYKQAHPVAFGAGRMVGEVPGIIAGGGAARVGTSAIPALARFAEWAPRTTRALTDVASTAPVAERGTEGGLQLATAPILGGAVRGVAGLLGRRFPRLGRALGAVQKPGEGRPATPAEPPSATRITPEEAGLLESPRVPPMDEVTTAAHTKVMSDLSKHDAMMRKFDEASNMIRDSIPDEVFDPRGVAAEELPELAGKRARDIWSALVQVEGELTSKSHFGESGYKLQKKLASELGLTTRLDPAYGEDPEQLVEDIGRALMDRLKKLATKKARGAGGTTGGATGEPPTTPGGQPPAGEPPTRPPYTVGEDGVPVLTDDVGHINPSTGQKVVIPAGTRLTPENLAKLNRGMDLTPEPSPTEPDVPRGTSELMPTGEAPDDITSTIEAYRQMSRAGDADPALRKIPEWREAYNRHETAIYDALTAQFGPDEAMNKLDDLAAVGVAPGEAPLPVTTTQGSIVQGGGTEGIDVTGIRGRLAELGPKLQQAAHRYAQAMADAARGDAAATTRASTLESRIRQDLASRGIAEEEQNAVLSYLQSRGSTGLDRLETMAPRMTPLPPEAGGEGVLTTPETSAAPGRINDPLVTSRRLFAKDVEQAVNLLRKLGNREIPNRWDDLAGRRFAGGDESFAADAHRLVQHLTRAFKSRPIAALKKALAEDPKKAALIERAIRELQTGGRGGGRAGKKVGPPEGGGGPQTGGRLTPEEAKELMRATALPGGERRLKNQLSHWEHFTDFDPSNVDNPWSVVDADGRILGDPKPTEKAAIRAALRRFGLGTGGRGPQTGGRLTPEEARRRLSEGGIPLSPDPTPDLTAASGRVFGVAGTIPPDMEHRALQIGRQLITEGIKTPSAWKNGIDIRTNGAFTPDQLDALWDRFTGGG